MNHVFGAALQISVLKGLPEIAPGDDLAGLIAESARKQAVPVGEGDVFVVAHKVVSKAEGRVVELEKVRPSERASEWAAAHGKNPRVIELVLREASRIVKMERGIIVAETRSGFVCANAGVDCSNTAPGTAILLPEDPDRSARQLRAGLRAAFGVDLGVIISDSFGRPWREGIVDVALGIAGTAALVDYRGKRDAQGNLLQMTMVARADELASAAELVMGKSSGFPVAIIQGLSPQGPSGSGRDLIRRPENDLFR